MVRLNKIYTRTGDKGTTALAAGKRRVKFDLRVAAYGTVDETNSTVGLARLYTRELPELDQTLAHIQNDLFDLGADLATPDTGEPPEHEPLRITEQQVVYMEKAIDLLNANIEPLTSFVLPGGTPAAAHLHQCRTVSRRAERIIVELAAREQEIVNDVVIRYINRLSDYFFVASRWCNDLGRTDVLWVPGKNRESAD